MRRRLYDFHWLLVNRLEVTHEIYGTPESSICLLDARGLALVPCSERNKE